MTYLNTHARTTTPTKNDKFQPAGRAAALFGVFIGFVKDSQDIQRNGRLRVWVPELGSSPDNPDGWIIVNYCSPFAGATNNETTSKADVESFEGTQTSYGFWAVPPDVNNQVLVMFVNGDPSRGFWIGSVYDQYMNNMVPGMAADSKNWQYPGKSIPVAEYNKWDTKVTRPDRAFHPYEKTKFKGLGNQGLITDPTRGTTSSSARRESPSAVFGIITPGPIIEENVKPESYRRKGGSSFIMDDGLTTEYVQLTTKSGAQIRLDETNGFVYMINRDGTSWVQMDQYGNIDIFGAGDISMRAQRDLNIRADRNVNVEAGQNIFMKAAKDTKKETTSFTYDVNNIPRTETIPYWKYVGEGQGEGGDIVMQALNNWQSTTKNTAYLTVVDNNMNISIGNAFSLTTKEGGQDYNSKMGVKVTTDSAVDIGATGNIRIGSKGSVNVVGSTGIVLCTNSDLSLNAMGNIIETAGAAYSLDAASIGFGTSIKIAGNVDLTGVVTAATHIGSFPGLMPGPGASNGGPGAAPALLSPIKAEAALSSSPARPAEVKPLNEKINILATWSDPESKFKRNSEPLKTTTSRFPTYEPCPEHESFNRSSISGSVAPLTTDDKTYEGSSGAGNNATTPPPATVAPGSNNTSVAPDSDVVDSFSQDINLAALKTQLEYHEGVVYKTYLDTSGLPHAGVGHLLRANEISQYPVGSPVPADQIDLWYTQDSASAVKIAQNLVGSESWEKLSDVRKRAVVDLSYNLGKTRLSKFTKFLAAIKTQNYDKAAIELRDSTWFGQVGRRGPNVVNMIGQNVDIAQVTSKLSKG